MSNLTITIDDDLLRAARVKAAQQGTSVNEVCRQAIAAFAIDDAELKARAQAFWDHAHSVPLGRAVGPRPSRADLDRHAQTVRERSPAAPPPKARRASIAK